MFDLFLFFPFPRVTACIACTHAAVHTCTFTRTVAVALSSLCGHATAMIVCAAVAHLTRSFTIVTSSSYQFKRQFG